MGSYKERSLYRSEFLPSPTLSSSPASSPFISSFLRLRRIIGVVFAPLPITNHISLPVFRILLPVTAKRRHQLLRGAHGDDDQKFGKKPSYSTPTTLFALLTTILFIFVFVFVVLLIFHLNLYTVITRAYAANRSTLGSTSQEDLTRVWLWEIASGHYPSRRRVGRSLITKEERTIENPAIPPRPNEAILSAKEHALEEARAAQSRTWRDSFRARYAPPTIVPVGASREYISLPRSPYSVEQRVQAAHPLPYPPRPLLGSTIDLDGVLQYCEFPQNYVRDCLEVLRLNAGFDLGFRPSFALPDALSITYLPSQPPASFAQRIDSSASLSEIPELSILLTESPNFDAFLSARARHTLTPSHPPFVPHPTHPTADPACNPDDPRIFHVFWTGPFTDKPYLLALSFLYTQPLSLTPHSKDTKLCRPQLWIWINPGPASSRSTAHAREKMLQDLDANEWARPLLHERFKDAIKFKLWDTSAQLDAIEEMKGWRKMQLFNSGGVTYGDRDSDPRDDEPSPANETVALSATAAAIPKKPAGELFERVGSISEDAYDRLSVVLSDMARFVLTHRFGGIYLDADTIFLRDWEELWGWKGAFAYRWSRLVKYNTAVLKMQRGSALGNFIFRAAVRNSLDFHPMTVSRYMKDAGMEDLLLMMPDALFDSAWLNTEEYQRDRPPYPYFERFEELFETPDKLSATPNMLGFEGFFRGAFSYHYHNCWWLSVDPARNFPELGPRFGHGEAGGPSRTRASAAATTTKGPMLGKHIIPDDIRDMSWATMLKRTFEQFIRGERPNMYGEWLSWQDDEEEEVAVEPEVDFLDE